MKISITDIQKKVNSFLDYDNDWDGFGGVKISPLVINNVMEVIKDIPNKYLNILDLSNDIVPENHGTITIEWYINMKNRLEIEIGDKAYSIYCVINNRKILGNYLFIGNEYKEKIRALLYQLNLN